MGYHQPPQDIDSQASVLIRRKVQSIVGRFGFSPTDKDDLTQELALQVHLAEPRFNAEKARAVTFYNNVIGNKARDLIRSAKARKRNWGRRRSLAPTSSIQARPVLIDLKLDVDQVMAALPLSDRAVVELLPDRSLAQVAQHLGTTRGKARAALARIANHFEKLRPSDGRRRTA